MKTKENLIKLRQGARDANRDSVVIRYIQFMLGQQLYARLREADAYEVVQKSTDKDPTEWWFATEGKKFICFYVYLAGFEGREINISEMAYQLNKSREFCSRTLATARRMGLLSNDNKLSEDIENSIHTRILIFLDSRAANAFVRTAMVRMIMQTALVMESENADEYKKLRATSITPEKYDGFFDIDDVIKETVNIDRFEHAAE